VTRSKNIHRMAPHQTPKDLNEESQRVDEAAMKVFEALRSRGDVAWFLLDKLDKWVAGPWRDGGAVAWAGPNRSFRKKPKSSEGFNRELTVVHCDDNGRGGNGPPGPWEWGIYDPKGEEVASGVAGSMMGAQDAADKDLRARGYILP